MAGQRLNFEIDTEIEESLITAHAGVAGLIEAFRQTGAAAVVDAKVRFKTRDRDHLLAVNGELLGAMGRRRRAL